MAQHGGEGRGVVGVFAEGVILGNRFRFGVRHKFVRIAASRLAIECSTPLPEYLLEFFLRHVGKLADGLKAQSAKCPLGHFSDAWNSPHGKRGKKTRLA